MQPESEMTSYIWKAFLCCAYIAISATLIRFNKFMMQPDQFPFSMALTAIHMLTSFVLCVVLYSVRPSAFPGMEKTVGRRTEVLKWFVPVGACFAISLYCSNRAYEYSSVAFLQFMKEGNLILAFFLSCLAGLQSPDRVKLVTVLWVMLGSSMAVGGEVHFLFLGFIFQLASQAGECTRIILGEILMGGRGGLKLDPMTYTMFAAPTCLCLLVVGNAVAWNPEIPSRLLKCWPYLVPNALVAFALNITVATVLKELSAVGFILAGVVKDITLVLVSAVLFGELVTAEQAAGFTVALLGVSFWSLMKAQPQHPAVLAFGSALGMPDATAKGGDEDVPEETTGLLNRKETEKEKV